MSCAQNATRFSSCFITVCSTTPMTMVISLPGLASGVTYTLHTGGTVSGGTEFHGYYTNGATVTGTTTQVKSFTLGSAAGSVTTP